MSFYEYELRMRANQLKDIDAEYRIRRLAWANREVEAQKKTGKGKKGTFAYVYKEFEDFFDYEEIQRKIMGEELDKDPGKKRTNSITERYMEFERRRRNGEL